MTTRPNNIILIGMPGCGKSTIGVLLAKRLAYGFVDTDLLIEQEQQQTLEKILLDQGYMELRRIEERILMNLRLERHVVATGGSAVYSESAIRHLKSIGTLIYLDTPYETLLERVGNLDQRGVARAPEYTFRDVYDERTPLYRRAKDITITTDGNNADQVADQLSALWGQR